MSVKTVLAPLDPRALAARKSRDREARKWLMLTDEADREHRHEMGILWKRLNRALRALASETARANAWRNRARALKAANRWLRVLLTEVASGRLAPMPTEHNGRPVVGEAATEERT